jgi:predicted transcriptional regulator
MTPERLREIRETMHLTVRGLARWADISATSIRQMESGQRPIPAAFGAWIDQLGRWQKKYPPPAKSR